MLLCYYECPTCGEQWDVDQTIAGDQQCHVCSEVYSPVQIYDPTARDEPDEQDSCDRRRSRDSLENRRCRRAPGIVAAQLRKRSAAPLARRR